MSHARATPGRAATQEELALVAQVQHLRRALAAAEHREQGCRIALSRVCRMAQNIVLNPESTSDDVLALAAVAGAELEKP